MQFENDVCTNSNVSIILSILLPVYCSRADDFRSSKYCPVGAFSGPRITHVVPSTFDTFYCKTSKRQLPKFSKLKCSRRNECICWNTTIFNMVC